MKKVILATAVALAMTAGVAQAQTDTQPVQTTNWSDRWSSDWTNDIYVGANIGHSNLRHASSIGGMKVDNSDTSYGLTMGYQFHKNFAVELGYTKLGEFGTDFGDIKANSWDFSLVGKYPIYNALSATAKVGWGYTEARFQSDRNRHTTGVYGLGLEYAVNKNVAVTTNWNRYHNFGDFGKKLDNVSVGLKYTF